MARAKEEKQYKVQVHIARNGEAFAFDAQIYFDCDPDDYGNGYSMCIESEEEPFGFQGYDIRYDKEFSADSLIEYIVKFYARRFDGRETEYDTKWKLTGISVYEVEPAEA